MPVASTPSTNSQASRLTETSFSSCVLFEPPNSSLSKSVIPHCAFLISKDGHTISVPNLEISALSWGPCHLPSQPRSSYSENPENSASPGRFSCICRVVFLASYHFLLGSLQQPSPYWSPSFSLTHFPHCFHGNPLKTPTAQSYHFYT